MDFEDVDFLRRWLDLSPDMRERIRFDPVRVSTQGQWLRVSGIEPRRGGLSLQLERGETITVSRTDAGLARLTGRDRLFRMLHHNLPGWSIVSAAGGTDRVNHQSGAFLRVVLRRGQRLRGVMGVAEQESGQLLDRLLTSALLWWDDRRGSFESLDIVLPDSWGEQIAAALESVTIPVKCHNYPPLWTSPARLRWQQILPRPIAFSRVSPPFALYEAEHHPAEGLASLWSSHPWLSPRRYGRQWQLCHQGLPIAWQKSPESPILFDWLAPTPFAKSTYARFREHLSEVRRVRSFPPPEPGHRLYRSHAEAWMEEMLRKNHRLIDPEFCDPIYSQVPTSIDGHRGVLDLITLRADRLAVLELKAQQDLSLLFQALDYWRRVEEHARAGDFQSAGYFPDNPVSHSSPLLYLICPLFEFHRTMPVLRRYLDSAVRFRCIGINSDWRRGIPVLRRFEF